MNKKKTILISVIILGVAALVVFLIFRTEPTAEKTGARKETAMLVNIITVKKDSVQPVFQATGIVVPSEEIMLSPRVSGEIIRRYQNFLPGSTVKKGEPLLEIDPADYKNILELRKSELMQAEADLNIEKGRQDIARQDYQLVGDTLTGMNKELVLREPQLNAMKAAYKAAKASVDQAQLNLQRTRITAPFDAQILERNVNTGSQVAPGDNLGRLVNANEYWVVVNIPASKLAWLSFAENNSSNKGTDVEIVDKKAWKTGSFRKGFLSKMIGALEEQTRLARLIVTVSDPLAREDKNKGKPSLLINSFVEVNITANKLHNVIRLNRDYLRKNQTVWLMKNNRLSIREVDILVQDNKYAYITEGLNNQDSVITSSLATVAEGARLRLEEENDDNSEGQNQKEDSQ